MKILAEYLENAVQFEQMAADAKDPKLKAEFERKAASYRKRAENTDPPQVEPHTPLIARLMPDTTDRTNKWRSAA